MNIGKIISLIEGSLKGEIDKNLKISINSTETPDGFKIEIVGQDESKIQEIESKNLRISKAYGFTQNIVGMEFTTNGKIKKQHKIIGFKTANRKYPIITRELISGLSYKFPIDMVKKQLGGDKIINRNANLKKFFEDE